MATNSDEETQRMLQHEQEMRQLHCERRREIDENKKFWHEIRSMLDQYKQEIAKRGMQIDTDVNEKQKMRQRKRRKQQVLKPRAS